MTAGGNDVTEPAMTLGSGRAAAVLDPSFVEGLADLPTEEVRRRRDESLAEREFLSYLRRLLQARQDILASERSRREAGGESEPLVERLTAALTRGTKAEGTRGEAVRTMLSDQDLEEAQRQADAFLPGPSPDDPEGLADQDLELAVTSLAQAER